MNPIWVDVDGALLGEPPHTVIDPGVGPDRYRTAFSGLRSTGRNHAFAAFTFDPDEAGSAVIVPTRVAHHDRPARPAPIGGAVIVDDGVAGWREGFRRAMTSIDSGEVEKVVLARRMTLETPQIEVADSIVRSLAGEGRADYVFGIDGLVGASPELLVSLVGDRVTSLVLAGTATDPRRLTGPKIEEEHRHAVESARNGLSELISDIKEKEQIVVQHGAVSHLGTRIVGRAEPGTLVTDLLAALHPTASVAGTPTRAALDLIRRIEPGSRGRYAGPVGWFDNSGQGVFALALRCGQVSGNRITLFGGGGLVSGSEEESELVETELKLETMLSALGQSPS